ncbi:MAG TPA: hypothetical protein VF719_10070 [Abditibacteriaceae bacterium]|jgi:hypothetical protein
MNPLDLLFGQIRNTISNHSSPNTPGPSYDPSDLLGQLSGIFGQHANERGETFGGYDNNNQGQYGNVQPASQDPYGDPADQQFGNVRPASEDPYGDPADGR